MDLRSTNYNQKNIIAETNIRFTNPNIFKLFHSFSLNTCDQSFDMFPKHSGYAVISETLALN